MSEDIHQFMCDTTPAQLHEIINAGLPSVGQKIHKINTPSQEDWAMALTVKQNSGYFDHMKGVANTYARMRNGQPGSAYSDFDSDSLHGKTFKGNLAKIKEWQDGKGPCAFHNAKPHASLYE